MRYAVLSDIHGNLEALTAVLASLANQRIDRYLCLGDIIGYGADPEACLAQMQTLEALSVAGNHEWACLGKLDPRWLNDAGKQAILWTRDRLGFGELDWLRRLPLTATEEPTTLVHAGLHHPERFGYLLDVAQTLDTAARCETSVCLVGHTHVPGLIEYHLPSRQVVRVLTSARDLTDVRITLDAQRQRRYVINPGSVGQPRDGDPRASYAILDTAAGSVSILRIPYDLSLTQQKIRRAGLPGLLADRLALGR